MNPTILTPYFRTYPYLYHKCGNMVIFRPGNLYSLCSPGNQEYLKIIHFKICYQIIAKVDRRFRPFLMHKLKNKILSDNAGFRGYKMNIRFWPKNYHILKFVVQKWVRPKKRRHWHECKWKYKRRISNFTKVHADVVWYNAKENTDAVFLIGSSICTKFDFLLHMKLYTT